MMMAYRLLIILRVVFMAARPFSVRIGVESIRGFCVQTAQHLACFICPNFIMPVCVCVCVGGGGGLLFNMADLVKFNRNAGV